MRRKDREISDQTQLRDILDRADVCRIAFSVKSEPYLVPLNFGYQWDHDGLVLYFHCARQGKKLDMIRENNNVCFEVDVDHKLLPGKTACDWGMSYKSIIGRGILDVVQEQTERIAGLTLIMRHYGSTMVDFNQNILGKTEVLRLIANELCGKQKGS
jgi:uncharacterized protein